METAIVPGINLKLFRGQQRPEDTAIGTMRALVAIDRRAAPVL